MKQFLSVADAGDLNSLISEALEIKKHPFAFKEMGRNKTIALLFMNPSLRTRLSTQKAAINLGMDVMVVNMDKDSWQIEFEDGVIMNSGKSEHIREAAAVISQYCDVIGLRCFPGLIDRDKDYNEQVLGSFLKYCNKPIISLESGTRHPLQSFADMISISETWIGSKPPKVVLTWAPHIKALPQAVPNSFAEWAVVYGADVTIAQPEGYELAAQFSKGAEIAYNQDEALKGADFVYVKNWSSYNDYGAMPTVQGDWLLAPEKLKLTNQAKVMHCLPVRRVWAAQTVIKKILEGL
jgi:N-succinyl-L-ornithine transcarbamylase